MLKDELKGFILKRMLILYTLLSVPSMLFLKERWLVLAGFTGGALYSYVRFTLLEYTFASMFSDRGKKASALRTVSVTVISFMVLTALLIISIKMGMFTFIGALSGILLVPVIIIYNSITEALGITHNNFK